MMTQNANMLNKDDVCMLKAKLGFVRTADGVNVIV